MQRCVSECLAFSWQRRDLGGMSHSLEAAVGWFWVAAETGMVGTGGTVLSNRTLVPQSARPKAVSRKHWEEGIPAAAERLNPKPQRPPSPYFKLPENPRKCPGRCLCVRWLPICSLSFWATSRDRRSSAQHVHTGGKKAK